MVGFDEYQKMIIASDTAEQNSDILSGAFAEKIFGLAGESGEVIEKFKKIVRDKGGKLSDEDKKEIAKELGDVTWYVATIARYMDLDFSEVVNMNIEKMQSRLERGKLHGSGDNR